MLHVFAGFGGRLGCVRRGLSSPAPTRTEKPMSERLPDHDLTELTEAAASGVVNSKATLHGGPTWQELSPAEQNAVREVALPFVFHSTKALADLGYRKMFDGDCGLSSIDDAKDREAAEAWMRWANLVNIPEDGNGIAAMKQMLAEFGYQRVAQ